MQELLEDLRQKHSVVRDQSSWGDDTNPFCCDRCWDSSSLPGPSEEEPAAALPVEDPHGEVNSSPWVSDDAAYSPQKPQHPALKEARTGEKSALTAGALRSEGNQGDRDGAAPAPSSNTAERGDRSSPPIVLPTALLGSIGEDACTKGSIRGAGGTCLELQGGAGARADQPPPTQRKADAVAAAFSAHLRGVDKYPLELARLCRFAQFLTENELLREAHEVSFG